MSEGPPNEDRLEAVTLSPSQETKKETTVSPSASDSAPSVTGVAAGADAGDVDALLDELDDPFANNAEGRNRAAVAENVDRFVEQSGRISAVIGSATRNIDTKYGVSTSVQQLDQTLGVSNTVKTGMSGLASLWKDLDLGTKTSAAAKTMGENVQPLTRGIADTAEEVRWKDKVASAERNVKEFDQRHGISSKVTGVLADGAEFLANQLDSVASSATTAPESSGTNVSATAAVSDDDLFLDNSAGDKTSSTSGAEGGKE